MDIPSINAKSKNSLTSTIPVVIVLVVLAFIFGWYIGGQRGEANGDVLFNGIHAEPPVGVDFDPLWKSWQVLEDKFVPATTTEIATDEEKVYGAIEGLTDSFGDPYTVFLPPADAEIFEEDISGSFGGVGMEIGIRDSTVSVISPLKDTPAYRAGIQAGDKIIRIDETSTEGMTIDEAVKLIRGEVGTSVKLSLLREDTDDLVIAEVVRAIIQIPTIESEIRDDGVFVIRLFNFSAISPNLFRDALRSFILSGSHKLVLDLRGNPGGFLEVAVDMASWFLPTGKVIVTEDFGENESSRAHRSRGYDIFNDNLEMIILVNQGSASASEILAGALREHGVATIVGEQTFGKGSVQELVDITQDTSLKVTIARWLTPNGTSISDGGLTPDVEVEMTREDVEAGLDPHLDRAVEILLVQ